MLAKLLPSLLSLLKTSPHLFSSILAMLAGVQFQKLQADGADSTTTGYVQYVGSWLLAAGVSHVVGAKVAGTSSPSTAKSNPTFDTVANEAAQRAKLGDTKAAREALDALDILAGVKS